MKDSIKCETCKNYYDFSSINKIAGHNYCISCSKNKGRGRYVRKLNKIIVEESIAYILPNNSDELILVDTDALELLSKYTWNVHIGGYAISKINHKHVRMHHLLLDFKFERGVNTEVDHKNGNKLDNRMVNLRVVSKTCNQQNAYNTLSSTGERFISKFREWYRVSVTINGKQLYFGDYKVLDDAINIRNRVITDYQLEEPYCGWSRLGV